MTRLFLRLETNFTHNAQVVPTRLEASFLRDQMSETGKSTTTQPPRKRDLQSVLVPVRRSWVTMALFMMSITKALAARLLFAIHGIVTVWRVASVKGSAAYYLMLMPVALMPGEMIFTLHTTDAGEWKW